MHSIASSNNIPTTRKETRLDIPNSNSDSTCFSYSLIQSSQHHINQASDWEMPSTPARPLHCQYASGKASQNSALSPQFCNPGANSDGDDDGDDECDVPELITEDSMDRNLSLDVLSPPIQSGLALTSPTAVSAPSLQGLVKPPSVSGGNNVFMKTTTTTPSILKPSTTTLFSCLKEEKKSKSPPKSLNIQSPTERRVRGLWDTNITTSSDITDGNTTNSKKTFHIFSKLRDETILHCLSFLSGEPTDLLAVAQVGGRFHSLVTTSLPLWKTIDATQFVSDIYNQSNESSHTTTKALAKLLLQYPPESLIIRNIGEKLEADESFLPPIGRLKKLTLSNFDDLTDTHVHVMLLLLALPSKKQTSLKKLSQMSTSSLQHLALEHCPKLTNDTVRSIASSPSCVEIHSLSIKGDEGISDPTPLSKLLQTKMGTSLPTLRSNKRTTLTSGFSSLFGSESHNTPKPAPAGLASLFGLPSSKAKSTDTTTSQSPPVSPPRNRTDALHSLFAPPGTSPPRNTRPSGRNTSATSTIRPMVINSRSHPTIPKASSTGRLDSVDIRSTGITPKAWLKCCQETATSSCRKLSLKKFCTDGDEWTTPIFQDFCELLFLRDLKCLQLAATCQQIGESIANTKVLDGGTRLRSLVLTGHACDGNGCFGNHDV